MTFEYRIVNGSGSDEDDQKMLNELGAEGFELVSVQVFSYEPEDADENEDYDEELVEMVVTYYLKRQK